MQTLEENLNSIMKKKNLKPGIVLKCRPNSVVGYFSFDNSISENYIVIRPKTAWFNGDTFHNGDSEVLLYIGSREETTLSNQLTLFTETADKQLEVHEVLWRGSIFRIRETSLKFLFPIK